MSKSLSHSPILPALRLAQSPPIAITIGLNLVFLIVFIITGFQSDVDIAALMRDPVATAKLPFYTGVFSSLGILFWCVASTLCLSGSLLLTKFQLRSDMRLFLWYSGLLSLFLTLDDLFLFHEYDGLFPVVFHIPEKVVYLLYGIIVISYLVRFRRTILRSSGFMLMGLALGLLGLSIGLDAILVDIFDLPYQLSVLIEDGAKLMGIVSWCGYFLSICWEIPNWITDQRSEMSF